MYKKAKLSLSTNTPYSSILQSAQNENRRVILWQRDYVPHSSDT